MPNPIIPDDDSESTRDRSALELARHYYETRGWTVIPVKPLEKDPGYGRWEQIRYASVDEIDREFAKRGYDQPNIGVLNGAASDNLIDIDCDIPEAVSLVSKFLPTTPCAAGKTSVRMPTHHFYKTTGDLPATKAFKLPITGHDTKTFTTALEFRANGHTVLPPSGYANGDKRIWFSDNEPLKVDGPSLRKAAGELAGAAALAHIWPSRGSRHEAAVALCGALLRGGWSEDKTFQFLGYVCMAAGEDWKEVKEHRLSSVRTTMATMDKGDPVTGWPTLAKLLPYNNSLQIVRLIAEWLELDWKSALNPRDEAMLTDVGNSILFERLYGEDLHFTDSHGWAVFTGTHWNFETGDNAAKRWAKQLGDDVDREASNATDLKLRERMEKHARTTRSKRSIEVAMSLSESSEGIWLPRSAFDNSSTTRGFLNTPSGVVDLRTGQLQAHSRSRYMSLITRAGYTELDSNEKPKLSLDWERAINFMTQEDPVLIELFQLLAGYIAFGGNPSDYLVIVRGEGGTGKTTFQGALMNVLGSYAMGLNASVFFQKRASDGPSPELASTVGKRGIFIDEVSRHGVWDEALTKQMSGQSPLTARQLHRDPFTFYLDGLVVVNTNHDISFSADDTGIWRRIKFIHLTAPNVPRIIDDSIRARLLDRMNPDPSVLAWIIEGARMWYRSGQKITFPDRVIQDTQDLRNRMDHLERFIDEFLIRDPDGLISAGDMVGMYNSWAGPQRLAIQNYRTMSDKLTEKKFDKIKKNGKFWYQGLRMDPVGKSNVLSIQQRTG